MKIKLTSIPVTDPIKAFNFYTNILGFQENLFMPEANLAIIVSPEAPNGCALLLEPIDNDLYKNFQAGVQEKGLPVIVFGVENVQQEYERLTALGVKFKKGPTTNDWGTEAIFDDTCGNYIQIHQS